MSVSFGQIRGSEPTSHIHNMMPLAPSSTPAQFDWIAALECNFSCYISRNLPRSIEVTVLSAVRPISRYVCVKFEWIPCCSGEVKLFPSRIWAAGSGGYNLVRHTQVTQFMWDLVIKLQIVPCKDFSASVFSHVENILYPPMYMWGLINWKPGTVHLHGIANLYVQHT